MAKFLIKTYNNISKIGLDRFGSDYKISQDANDPDVILLRSYDLHGESAPSSLSAVGRAGAGVNNIPVDDMSASGVVVFNAPGANANSVKELAIAGMLMAVRNIPGALDYVKNLDIKDMKKSVEQGKKQFAGAELYGKTLGVIGLGAIGYRVANTASELGMNVLGYDPAMTVGNAWQLNPKVNKVDELDYLLENSDIVTLHVPLIEPTKGMMDSQKLGKLKKGAILINLSRDLIVDEKALLELLDRGEISYYVTDFPNELTYSHTRVIAMPHLGASTEEAEDSSAIMVVNQLKDYLENGNIENSVNFPTAKLPKKGDIRLTLAHKNETGMVAQITKVLGEADINIIELLNKSRGDLAYTILDLEVKNLPKDVVSKLEKIPHLLKLRII